MLELRAIADLARERSADAVRRTQHERPLAVLLREVGVGVGGAHIYMPPLTPMSWPVM